MLSNFCYNICTVWWIKPYHISFPVFVGGIALSYGLLDCILCLYPAFVSVSLLGVTEFLNISSFADNCDNLNSIDFGSCLVMDGG